MQLDVGHTPVTVLQLPWQSAGLADVQRPVWPISAARPFAAIFQFCSGGVRGRGRALAARAQAWGAALRPEGAPRRAGSQGA